jgi:hypothetical protein
MDQERDNYADRDLPPPWRPSIKAMFMILVALAPILPLIVGLILWFAMVVGVRM